MSGADGRRLIPGSTTTRLIAAFMLAQLATLALGLYAMYSFTQSTITADARVAAEVARDEFRDILDHDGYPAVSEAIAQRLASHKDRNFVVFLRGTDGERLAGNLRAWPANVGDREKWRTIGLYREGAKLPETIGLVTTALPDGRALLTGEVLEAKEQLTRASARAFFYSLFAGLLLAALITALIARTLERRIDSFSAAAAEFSAGKLDARVARNRTGDAFDRLGISINQMLDRIERLVRELRVVTDSMAHDLRSPLSRIKAALEHAAANADSAGRADAMADAIDEVDGLHRMLDTSLEISRAEAGIGRDRFTDISVAGLLGDLAEVYGPLAEDEGFAITLDVPADLTVRGNRELVFRAMSNLIDNAIKYASGGTAIVLAARELGERIAITVSDDGPGIPEAKRQEALRRFGRLDPARSRSGAGLGLSLIETIAHLHGGKLTIEDNQPHGLRAVLELER